MIGWKMCHDVMMYSLYLDNPSPPPSGYAQEIERVYGLMVSIITISRWFLISGTFKGTMNVIYLFPSGPNSWSTYEYMCSYLDFL